MTQSKVPWDTHTPTQWRSQQNKGIEMGVRKKEGLVIKNGKMDTFKYTWAYSLSIDRFSCQC